MEIGLPDADTWREARAGERLNPGEALRTGWGGRAELALGHHRVRIYENSSFRLPAEAASSRERVWLDLGSALFDVTRRAEGERFEVHTPEAVAAVRGTRFGVSAGEDEVTLLVYEGAVALSSEGRPEVLVRAGFGAYGSGRAPFDVSLLEHDDPWQAFETSDSGFPRLQREHWLGRDAVRSVKDALSEAPEPAPFDRGSVVETDPVAEAERPTDESEASPGGERRQTAFGRGDDFEKRDEAFEDSWDDRLREPDAFDEGRFDEGRFDDGGSDDGGFDDDGFDDGGIDDGGGSKKKSKKNQ